MLGTGSVFTPPGEGSLCYLASLRASARLRSKSSAGHGPYVWDPAAKLDEYTAHRLEREQRLVDALEAGLRTQDELLYSALVRRTRGLGTSPACSLASHLEKLEEEGRLHRRRAALAMSAENVELVRAAFDAWNVEARRP